jgi:hypothetical protein
VGKRHIIKMLAAFISRDHLILEFADRILVACYYIS